MTKDADALIARARDLAPILRERGAEADRNRAVSNETMALVHDAGFLRILQPKENGGYGLPPDVLWRVTCEIGRGCASTAWLVGLSGANVWLLSLFDAAAREEIFAKGASVLVPVMTGGVGRDLVARETSDGYMISGAWRYASGIDHADWVAVLAPLPDGPALAVIEASAFSIDQDSWQVLGMRGTGSKDIALTETLVPHRRIQSWSAIQAGRDHADPLYRLPANPFLGMSIAAPLIGTAGGIVESLLEAMRFRLKEKSGPSGTDDPRAFTTLGQCMAEIDMAETALYENSARLYAAGIPDLVERARIRAATVVAARTALAAADRAASAAGGALLRQGTALERGFRDIHAMASHFLVQPDISAEAHGRLLLDLPPPDAARL